MGIKLSIIVVFLSSLVFCAELKGQDPVFSQFYSSPLVLNPAFAGTNYDGRVTAQSRYQWPSLRSQYQSYLVSYDQFWRKYNSGLGGYLMYDDAGDGILRSINAALTYSYRLRINDEWETKLGAEVGYVQSQVDWDQLVFGDQLSPVTGQVISPSGELEPENLSQGAVTAGIGLLVYSKRYYLGFAVKHLNTPNIQHLAITSDSEDALPSRLVLNAGAKYDLRGGRSAFGADFVSPGLLFVNQGDFYQLTGGAQVGLNILRGGLWYRHAWNNSDAVILALGVDQVRWQLNYSYDITISDVAVSTGGSHEVSFFFLLNTDRNSRYEDCFAIFR